MSRNDLARTSSGTLADPTLSLSAIPTGLIPSGEWELSGMSDVDVGNLTAAKRTALVKRERSGFFKTASTQKDVISAVDVLNKLKVELTTASSLGRARAASAQPFSRQRPHEMSLELVDVVTTSVASGADKTARLSGPALGGKQTGRSTEGEPTGKDDTVKWSSEHQVAGTEHRPGGRATTTHGVELDPRQDPSDRSTLPKRRAMSAAPSRQPHSQAAPVFGHERVEAALKEAVRVDQIKCRPKSAVEQDPLRQYQFGARRLSASPDLVGNPRVQSASGSRPAVGAVDIMMGIPKAPPGVDVDDDGADADLLYREDPGDEGNMVKLSNAATWHDPSVLEHAANLEKMAFWGTISDIKEQQKLLLNELQAERVLRERLEQDLVEQRGIVATSQSNLKQLEEQLDQQTNQINRCCSNEEGRREALEDDLRTRDGQLAESRRQVTLAEGALIRVQRKLEDERVKSATLAREKEEEARRHALEIVKVRRLLADTAKSSAESLDRQEELEKQTEELSNERDHYKRTAEAAEKERDALNEKLQLQIDIASNVQKHTKSYQYGESSSQKRALQEVQVKLVQMEDRVERLGLTCRHIQELRISGSRALERNLMAHLDYDAVTGVPGDRSQGGSSGPAVGTSGDNGPAGRRRTRRQSVLKYTIQPLQWPKMDSSEFDRDQNQQRRYRESRFQHFVSALKELVFSDVAQFVEDSVHVCEACWKILDNKLVAQPDPTEPDGEKEHIHKALRNYAMGMTAFSKGTIRKLVDLLTDFYGIEEDSQFEVERLKNDVAQSSFGSNPNTTLGGTATFTASSNGGKESEAVTKRLNAVEGNLLETKGVLGDVRNNVTQVRSLVVDVLSRAVSAHGVDLSATSADLSYVNLQQPLDGSSSTLTEIVHAAERAAAAIQLIAGPQSPTSGSLNVSFASESGKKVKVSKSGKKDPSMSRKQSTTEVKRGNSAKKDGAALLDGGASQSAPIPGTPGTVTPTTPAAATTAHDSRPANLSISSQQQDVGGAAVEPSGGKPKTQGPVEGAQAVAAVAGAAVTPQDRPLARASQQVAPVIRAPTVDRGVGPDLPVMPSVSPAQAPLCEFTAFAETPPQSGLSPDSNQQETVVRGLQQAVQRLGEKIAVVEQELVTSRREHYEDIVASGSEDLLFKRKDLLASLGIQITPALREAVRSKASKIPHALQVDESGSLRVSATNSRRASTSSAASNGTTGSLGKDPGKVKSLEQPKELEKRDVLGLANKKKLKVSSRLYDANKQKQLGATKRHSMGGAKGLWRLEGDTTPPDMDLEMEFNMPLPPGFDSDSSRASPAQTPPQEPIVVPSYMRKKDTRSTRRPAPKTSPRPLLHTSETTDNGGDVSDSLMPSMKVGRGGVFSSHNRKKKLEAALQEGRRVNNIATFGAKASDAKTFGGLRLGAF